MMMSQLRVRMRTHTHTHAHTPTTSTNRMHLRFHATVQWTLTGCFLPSALPLYFVPSCRALLAHLSASCSAARSLVSRMEALCDDLRALGRGMADVADFDALEENEHSGEQRYVGGAGVLGWGRGRGGWEGRGGEMGRGRGGRGASL